MTRRPREVRLNKRTNRTVVSLALLLAMFLSLAASACAKPEVTPPVAQGGQPEPVSPAPPDPSAPSAAKPNPLVYVDTSVRSRSFDVESVLGFPGRFATYPQHTLSSDGKFMLGVVSGEGRRDVVALPLDEGEAAVTIASLPNGGQNLKATMALGWTIFGDAVYLLEGVQPWGSHGGSEGIAIYRQKPGGSPKEVGFIPPGVFRGRCWFVPKSHAAFLKVSNALWKVDLLLGGAEEVISALPSYDGLLNPVLSPDGAYFAYRLHEPGRSGILVLDTRTKEETLLLPDGESMSFLPQWSPDSRWIAAYTVQRNPDFPGQVVYQEFGDVDGPLPISSSLTVASLRGFDAQEVAVSGKLLSTVRWAADGRLLSFQAGDVEPSGMIVPDVRWVQESLWVVPVNMGAILNSPVPEKVADLPRKNPIWFDQLPVPGGKTVYYSPDGESILRGTPGASPVQVAGAARFRPEEWWPFPYPVAGQLVVAWMWPPRAETKALWVFGTYGARKVAEYKPTGEFDAGVVACAEGMLVVYHSDRKADPLERFDVFTFNPDDFVPRYAEGDPLAKVKAAVSRYMAESNRADDILRILEVTEDYYLAELKPRGDEFFYLYVDKEGKGARPAVSHADRPVFSKCENGEVWFECNCMADNFTVFPYYDVTQPDPIHERRVPLFKPVGSDSYEVSHSGLAYRISDAVFSMAGIFMQMDITGPGKGGIMAGGGRPPRTYISEQGDVVTFRFEEVSLPDALKERLLAYENPFAKVLSVAAEDDFIEVAVRVTGEYSFELTAVIPGKYESELSPLGSSAVNILFQPRSKDDPSSPGPAEPLSTIAYLDPQVEACSVEADGYIYTYTQPQSSVSPDGKYIGANVGSTTITAFPASGDTDPVVVYRMEDTQGGGALIFAGWRSETECLFILFGVQSDGEHKGERGVSIRVGNLLTASSYEAAFMANTNWKMSWMAAGGRHLYVRVSKHLLEFDVETKQFRTVAELPGFEAGINAWPSPSGTQVLYWPGDPGRDGMAILDIEAGTDEILISNGDTFNFGPVWSPDGSMIAVYTAAKLPAEPGEPVKYDIIVGEDAELPISRRITILKPSGETVLTIDAREGYCHNLNWAPDSSAISYAEGSVPENRGFTGSAFIVERIVLRRIPGRGKGPEEQQPELSVDLSPPTGFRPYPGEGHHHPSVGGTSAFYVDRNGDLNRFSGSLPPETIRRDTEVHFWEPPVPDSPVLGDHLVCIVRDPDSNGTEIWLLGPNSCRRIVSYGGSANVINLSLLGLTDHTILVSRSASGHTNPNGPKDREHFLDIITLPESCLDE